jgi:hypothetical protein
MSTTTTTRLIIGTELSKLFKFETKETKKTKYNVDTGEPYEITLKQEVMVSVITGLESGFHTNGERITYYLRDMMQEDFGGLVCEFGDVVESQIFERGIIGLKVEVRGKFFDNYDGHIYNHGGLSELFEQTNLAKTLLKEHFSYEGEVNLYSSKFTWA